MNEQKIARINELYHKSKAEGLTEAEQTDKDKTEIVRLEAEHLFLDLNVSAEPSESLRSRPTSDWLLV